MCECVHVCPCVSKLSVCLRSQQPTTNPPSLPWPDEISFKEGDKIEVYDEIDDGWWSGAVVGSGTGPGIFPRNYVDAP